MRMEMKLLAVLFLLAGVGLVIYCIDRLIATHNARQSGDVSDHTQTYVLTSLGLGAGVLAVVYGGLSLMNFGPKMGKLVNL